MFTSRTDFFHIPCLPIFLGVLQQHLNNKSWGCKVWHRALAFACIKPRPEVAPVMSTRFPRMLTSSSSPKGGVLAACQATSEGLESRSPPATLTASRKGWQTSQVSNLNRLWNASVISCLWWARGCYGSNQEGHTPWNSSNLMTSYLFQTVSQSLRLAHAAENGFGCGHAIGWRFGRCHHGNTNETLVTDASFCQLRRALFCTF